MNKRKHLIIEEVDVNKAMEDTNSNMEKPKTIEKHVDLPPVYADAVEQHEKIKKNIGKELKDMNKVVKDKGIVPENPGTGKKISRKPYTEQYQLDESLFEDWDKSYDELPDKDDEIIYTQKDLYLSDEEFQDDFVVEEEIGDKLSDDYGFLHNGFSWKRDGNKIIVSNIDWEIDECLTEKRNNCRDGECEQPNKEKRAQRREQDAKHRDKRKWYDDDDLDEAIEDVAEEKVCDKCGKQPCVCECEESKLEEAHQPEIFECPICHRNFSLGECEHDDSMCQCPRCHSQLIKTDNGEYTEIEESANLNEMTSDEIFSARQGIFDKIASRKNQKFKKREDKEEKRLRCLDAINDVIKAEKINLNDIDNEAERILNKEDEYEISALKEYIDLYGRDKVLEMIKDQLRDENNVKSLKNESLEEDFNLTISLYEFEPWTDQARETWNKLNAEEGALDRLEWELELEYPEGMSETAFNDLLRFESDWVLQAAGIEEKPEEDEDDDDVYENLNTITESTDNVEWKNVCKAYCKKIGAELLFVNDYDFGYEDKNGNLVHKYADELENELKGQ